MPTEKKIKTVSRYKDKLKEVKSLIFTDYRGLTPQQMEELRKALKEKGGDLEVTKNTLLMKAWEIGNWKLKIENYLTGPTATLFIKEDIIPPLKELAKFIDQFRLPKIKLGIYEGEILTKERVLKLASLPEKEVLFAQVVSGLKNPTVRLTYALRFNIQKLALVLKAARQRRKR